MNPYFRVTTNRQRVEIVMLKWSIWPVLRSCQREKGSSSNWDVMVAIWRMVMPRRPRWAPDFIELPARLIRVGYTVGSKNPGTIFLKPECRNLSLMKKMQWQLRHIFWRLRKKIMSCPPSLNRATRIKAKNYSSLWAAKAVMNSMAREKLLLQI